jgi:hypothetical protein
MSKMCTENLNTIGMKCPNCGMYIKSYLIPDDCSILYSNTKPEVVKFVANFECVHCHNTWSVTRTTPQ